MNHYIIGILWLLIGIFILFSMKKADNLTWNGLVKKNPTILSWSFNDLEIRYAPKFWLRFNRKGLGFAILIIIFAPLFFFFGIKAFLDWQIKRGKRQTNKT